jgi:hypothetical protein
VVVNAFWAVVVVGATEEVGGAAPATVELDSDVPDVATPVAAGVVVIVES